MMYKTITTSMDKFVTLSGDHVMYAKKSDNEKFIPM